MGRFRIRCNYVKMALVAELGNVSRYVLFVVLFFLLMTCFSGVSVYLEVTNDTMNIFEIFIWFNSSKTTQMIYLVGIVLLSCGVFFFDSGAPYYLIRTDKKNWASCQMGYLFVMVLVYNLFIILSLWIAMGGNFHIAPRWSNASLTAASYSGDINIIPIISVSSGLFIYNPNFVALITFILSVSEGMCAGILMIVLSMKRKAVYASLIIFGGWFVDYLSANLFEYNNWFRYFSPWGLSKVACSSLNGESVSFIYAVAFMLCTVLLLRKFLLWSVNKIDFVKMN